MNNPIRSGPVRSGPVRSDPDFVDAALFTSFKVILGHFRSFLVLVTTLESGGLRIKWKSWH